MKKGQKPSRHYRTSVKGRKFKVNPHIRKKVKKTRRRMAYFENPKEREKVFDRLSMLRERSKKSFENMGPTHDLGSVGPEEKASHDTGLLLGYSLALKEMGLTKPKETDLTKSEGLAKTALSGTLKERYGRPEKTKRSQSRNKLRYIPKIGWTIEFWEGDEVEGSSAGYRSLNDAIKDLKDYYREDKYEVIPRKKKDSIN